MSTLRALLIGVDGHEPSRSPDGLLIRNLAGAAGDALRVERYLRDGPLAVPADRIRTLVSPSPLSDVPAPPPERLPTYANIVREIEALEKIAGEGDQILIHFSGHGVRVPSASAVKGRFGRDEALVPCDAGSPDGGVLRDVEMYRLLARLAKTGAYVTLILDACHSGGATRDAHWGWDQDRVQVRGLGERSGVWGPAVSAVGDWDDLYDSLERAESAGLRPGYRHFGAESGWFPQPKSCVLLAACSGLELAREQPFGTGGVAGAFTHSVLEGVGTLGEGVSYAELHRRVQRQIHGLWANQTPMLEGDGELRFLGGGRRPEPSEGGTEVCEGTVVQCRVGLEAGVDPDLLDRIVGGASSAVELVRDESGRADFLLGAGAGSAVEVRDAFGTPLAGVGEPVHPERPEAELELARRLEHMALYGQLRDLTTPADSPFRGALRLGLFRLDRKEDWHDPKARRPVRGDRVSTGELLCLILRNTSEQPLNAIVLDLRPDWAVERVHPAEDEGEFAVLEPGPDHPVYLGTWLPDGLQSAHSVLKVIASADPIDSRGLELTALEGAASNGSGPVVRPPLTLPAGNRWTVEELELTVVA